mmetsp:Transcript_461/g.1522  ORF Transcript_461/g.1522 Transcript_461/m.1522 type:complete len:313 (+) Transcript_461:80-1018(+)
MRHPGELASELARAGAAITPLPQGSVEPISAIFDYIADDILRASDQRLEFVPPETARSAADRCVAKGPKFLPWPVPADGHLGFHVGTQSTELNEDLTYVNPTNLATFARTVAPLRCALERVCQELYGQSRRIMTLSSTFVVGKEKLKPVAHVDFHSRNIVTLILPLYHYRPEDAALKYWRVDENPHLYPWGRARGATDEELQHGRPRIYPYRFGEGMFFTGDLWHQTVPFRCPPGGWGRARCRALFSIMCAAADALVQEASHPAAVGALAAAAGGYYVDPQTGEWLTPLPSVRSLAWQWLAARFTYPTLTYD